MGKFVVAGLIWRCFKYPKHGMFTSDFKNVENFVYRKIERIAAKYGITNVITETQKEDTFIDFWEALFNIDGTFFRNVRAKYFKSGVSMFNHIKGDFPAITNKIEIRNL